MKIKPQPKMSRKKRAYLKFMGLEKPRKQGRLAQLNKSGRHLRRIKSELQVSLVSRYQQEVDNG